MASPRDMKIRIGDDAYNVLQRYWEGQGDDLYALLSRRGHSVDMSKMASASRDRHTKAIK